MFNDNKRNVIKNFDLINMYNRLELILKINPKIQFGVGCHQIKIRVVKSLLYNILNKTFNNI